MPTERRDLIIGAETEITPTVAFDYSPPPSPAPSSHSAQMLHHFFFRLSLSDESPSMRWDAKFGNRRITKKKLSFETVV